MVYLQRLLAAIFSVAFLLMASAQADDSIPAPTRTIMVSSSSQLLSALEKAQPGDHIVLTNGKYSGFTVSRSGKNGMPVVIRAANKLSAKISGSPVTVSGDYVWLVGLDFTNGVVVEGTGDRVTSSRLKVKGTAIHLKATALLGHSLNAEIDHNEIISMPEPSGKTWNAIRVDVGHDDLGHKIYRNHIHGAPEWTAPAGAVVALQLGFSNHRLKMGRVLFELNLIEDWKNSDTTYISVKTSGHTLRLNTVIRGKQPATNREGHHNSWISNYFENTKGLRVRDMDTLIVGNVLVNGGAIQLMTGDVDPDTAGNFGDPARNDKLFPRAERTLVAGNTGKLQVGLGLNELPSITLKVLDTRIEKHSGTVELFAQEGTTQSPTTAQVYPAAFKLTPSDVGPFAPTAPQIDASV
jgi:poly(beta-D-mannuronate) lyase